MSVLVPDLEVYNYLMNAVQRAAYRRQCDQFYSYTMSAYFKDKPDIEKECRRLVKSWLRLNEMSWCARYKEKDEAKERLASFVQWEAVFDLDAYQILKYVKCVIYNIELSTIREMGVEVTLKQREDYDILELWEKDLMNAIISTSDAYDKAEWCNKPKTKIAV